MSYKEKQTIVMIGTQLAILICYCVYVLGQMRDGAASLDIQEAHRVLEIGRVEVVPTPQQDFLGGLAVPRKRGDGDEVHR